MEDYRKMFLGEYESATARNDAIAKSLVRKIIDVETDLLHKIEQELIRAEPELKRLREKQIELLTKNLKDTNEELNNG
ncbi:MAG: hypothetical protein ACRDBG_28325 [Waterburya sp.]